MRVEGIGEVLADAILAYRSERGGFTRRAELTEIHGIGEILSARIMAEFYIPDELPPAETMPAKTEIPKPDDVPKPEPEDVPEPAAEEPPEESAEDDRPELLFDLNAVTYEQLMLLPDMRPEWAEGIISVREKLEGYFSLEELGLVDGLPDVLALGAAIYPPEALISACAMVSDGKRTATVESPPVVSSGTASLF